LKDFIKHEPKMYVDLFRNLIDVPDVVDYTDKVKLFDPSFEMGAGLLPLSDVPCFQ